MAERNSAGNNVKDKTVKKEEDQVLPLI